MKHLLRRCAGSLTLAFGALCSLPALAVPYTSLTVFGDSLSDTGNIFLATGGAVPAAPYSQGRFSDGPVWIDALAAGLNLPLGAVPSQLPNGMGSNYAFGGARTGSDNSPPGVLAQIGGLWAPLNPAADPTGLYVVVGGGNDLRDARGATSTPDSRQAAAEAAAGNLASAVGFLASRGAKHVLISNVPDLGATPEAVAAGLTANSSDVTARFNLLLGGAEAILESTFAGLNVSFLDMAGLATAVRNDALNNGGAVYGITNVTTPCGPFTGSIGIACNVSLFSDALHPTTAHALIAQAALVAVVPEPGSWLLMVVGVATLIVKRRSVRVQ